MKLTAALSGPKYIARALKMVYLRIQWHIIPMLY